jgi:hypothetical protein
MLEPTHQTIRRHIQENHNLKKKNQRKKYAHPKRVDDVRDEINRMTTELSSALREEGSSVILFQSLLLPFPSINSCRKHNVCIYTKTLIKAVDIQRAILAVISIIIRFSA